MMMLLLLMMMMMRALLLNKLTSRTALVGRSGSSTSPSMFVAHFEQIPLGSFFVSIFLNNR